MEKNIKVTENGPYEVYGNIPLDEQEIKTDDKGYPLKYEKTKNNPASETYYLCRCGHSSTKPFCSWNHLKIKFNGKETAPKNKYIDRADELEGKNIILTDDFSLCSQAGFCHGREGETWDLIRSKDKKDNEIAIQQCFDCPSGRLVLWDEKTKKPIEPDFKPHISILYEPWKKVEGSIWVKGNIPIESSDGYKYEVRNRVTLCRCGKTGNMPFCDGTHRIN